MALSDELKQEISNLVTENRVVLFMKGTRSAPQCGFSASVVELLDELLDDYTTVDVLARPDLREGIKEFSDWPTIPQLYVGGELVGGADIVRQMFESGELAKTLGVKPGSGYEGPLPSITVTPAAAEQIQKAAAEDPEGPHLHLEITARFEHALFFQKPGRRHIEVNAGPLSVWLDAGSVSRADGLVIDYVEGPQGTGFKIDNPNKGRPDAERRAKANGAPPPLPKVEPPELTVTDAARAQFVAALEQEQASGDGDDQYGVRIGARRMGATKVDYELGIIAEAEKKDADLVVEQGGVRFYMDPLSAKNLDGAVIDFVENGEGGSGFKFENPKLSQGWKDPLADRFQRFLDEEINPSIASHGGYVQLLDLVGDTAYVLMGGGCQGCASASATLYDGIAERVKHAIPEVQHLIDTTDHAAGTNPYYRG